jgi:O-antigen/teichoic acid export membrane protein
VSVTLARFLIFPLAALEFVYMSVASELYARRQMEELGRTYQVLTKWVFSFTMPFFFILFSFPEVLVPFLFGNAFVESSLSLRILAVGSLINVFFGANGTLMVVKGMTKEIMTCVATGAVLNIILNYVLIVQWNLGAEGAAAATAFSYMVSNAMGSFLLYRRSRIHPFTKKYLKPVAWSFMVGMILYTFSKNLPNYFLMIPFYFILFVGGSIASLVVTRSLDREDIAMFEAISRKIGIDLSWVKRLAYKYIRE